MFHTKKHPTATKATFGFSDDDTLGITSTAANEAEMLVGGSPVCQWGALGSKVIGFFLGAITQAAVVAKGSALMLHKGVKRVTALADTVATDVLTVTIPNAQHSAILKVRYLGHLGAGGAVGAGEAVAGGERQFTIVRTAGVATVVGTAAASNASTAAVAGAATVTCTIAATAMTGATSATQTFTIQATITKSGGASDNHVAMLDFELVNEAASGISIA